MGASTVCFSLIILAMGVRRIEPSDEAMKNMNTGFVRVVEECKHELNLSEHVLAGLFHLWKMEYDQVSRDVGCIIICMSKKLDLFDVKGRLHHGNAQEFAMQHGADEELASKLVGNLHECEKQHDSIEDDCSRVLEVAKCFRTSLVELNWTPKAEFIVGEVLTGV